MEACQSIPSNASLLALLPDKVLAAVRATFAGGLHLINVNLPVQAAILDVGSKSCLNGIQHLLLPLTADISA